MRRLDAVNDELTGTGRMAAFCGPPAFVRDIQSLLYPIVDVVHAG